jgi:polyribonucleotide nucleotidyltransferase
MPNPAQTIQQLAEESGISSDIRTSVLAFIAGAEPNQAKKALSIAIKLMKQVEYWPFLAHQVAPQVRGAFSPVVVGRFGQTGFAIIKKLARKDHSELLDIWRVIQTLRRSELHVDQAGSFAKRVGIRHKEVLMLGKGYNARLIP